MYSGTSRHEGSDHKLGAIATPTSDLTSASPYPRNYRRETYMRFRQREPLFSILLDTGQGADRLRSRCTSQWQPLRRERLCHGWVYVHAFAVIVPRPHKPNHTNAIPLRAPCGAPARIIPRGHASDLLPILDLEPRRALRRVKARGGVGNDALKIHFAHTFE
jgi:hypothetical protein